MNPTDSTTPATTMQGISNKSANQNDATNQISGSELISYQPTTTPIDFTEFLNIDDDEQPLMTVNGKDE